jgi:hypothetical protein
MLDTKQIYLDTINNGGSSTNMSGNHPTTGYMVALEGSELMVKPDWFNIVTLNKFIEDQYNLLYYSNYYLGTWLDTNDNLVYLDVSVNVDNYDDAIKLAEYNFQLAIYDVVKHESVYL